MLFNGDAKTSNIGQDYTKPMPPPTKMSVVKTEPNILLLAETAYQANGCGNLLT